MSDLESVRLFYRVFFLFVEIYLLDEIQEFVAAGDFPIFKAEHLLNKVLWSFASIVRRCTVHLLIISKLFLHL